MLWNAGTFYMVSAFFCVSGIPQGKLLNAEPGIGL